LNLEYVNKYSSKTKYQARHTTGAQLQYEIFII